MDSCPVAIVAIEGNKMRNNESRVILLRKGHLAESQILLGLEWKYKYLADALGCGMEQPHYFDGAIAPQDTFKKYNSAASPS
jgi:hypothetical protein